MFAKLKWLPDRLIIEDLVFRLERAKSDQWDGPEHIMFHKSKGIISQYELFFSGNSDFHPQRVVELGIWDGGSLVFWNEVLKPEKIIGIDLANREDGSYFRSYVQSRRLAGRITTYWKTNQADKAKLQ